MNAFKVRTAVAATATTALLALGCAKQTTPSVAQSLKMTSSFQARPVAQNILDRVLDFILPLAQALVPSALVDSSGRVINLSSAWISIEEIEFETDESGANTDDDDHEIKFHGPYIVDLLASVPFQLDRQMLPQLSYKKIELKLHKTDAALPTGAPSQLIGNSIYLAGTIGSIDFSYTSDDTTDLEIAGPNGVTPDASKDLLVVLRFSDLFKRIDLSAISATTNISSTNRVPASNACPQIDTQASDLYTCIRKGLGSVSEFGEDDGDGDLDDSDDSSVDN